MLEIDLGFLREAIEASRELEEAMRRVSETMEDRVQAMEGSWEGDVHETARTAGMDAAKSAADEAERLKKFGNALEEALDMALCLKGMARGLEDAALGQISPIAFPKAGESPTGKITLAEELTEETLRVCRETADHACDIAKLAGEMEDACRSLTYLPLDIGKEAEAVRRDCAAVCRMEEYGREYGKYAEGMEEVNRILVERLRLLSCRSRKAPSGGSHGGYDSLARPALLERGRKIRKAEGKKLALGVLECVYAVSLFHDGLKAREGEEKPMEWEAPPGALEMLQTIHGEMREADEAIARASDLSAFSGEEIRKVYEGMENHSVLERIFDFSGEAGAEYAIRQIMSARYNAVVRGETLAKLKEKGLWEEFLQAYLPRDVLAVGFRYGLGNDALVSDGETLEARKELAERAGCRKEDLENLANYVLREMCLERMGEFAGEHPVAASGVSLVFNLSGSVQGGLAGVDSFLTGEPLKADGMGFLYRDVAGTIREEVSGGIENPVGRFAYGTVISAGDALLSLLACGGNPTGAAVVMGMGAYADTAKECVERGLPPEQMQATALAAGMFEYAFEKIKWDRIGAIAGGNASGSLLVNMGTAAVTNGLEEIGTDLCVTASDILINGGASEMMLLYNGYVEGGMDEEEAAAKVMGEYAKELALEGLAGAVAGGIMGGAAGIAGRKGNGSGSVTVDAKADVDGSVEVDGISGVHGGDVRADVDGLEGGSSTGTVWDNIIATQDNYPNTNIPKSFEVEVNGQKMWVHGNATEHMYEDVYAKIVAGEGTAYTNPNLYTQELMSDFYGSLEQATVSGIQYGELISAGNWEFIFAAPRQEGLLPVIKHAQFNGW